MLVTIAHADTVSELKREMDSDDTLLERVKNGVCIEHNLPAFANNTPDYDEGNGWRSSSVPSTSHA